MNNNTARKCKRCSKQLTPNQKTYCSTICNRITYGQKKRKLAHQQTYFQTGRGFFDYEGNAN